MTVNYYLNGTLFADYGVKIIQSKGILNALKMKEPVKTNWPDHHGEVIDLAAPRFEAREIVLECIIKATNSNDWIGKVRLFIGALQQAELNQIVIEIVDGATSMRPLVYMVFLQEVPDISKTWSEANMFGTFTLKLKEPEPVKRIYSTNSTSVSLTINTTDPVNIYWGDREAEYDVTTETGEITHSYFREEPHYIVITGIIDNINGVSTDATEVWNKLL